MLYIKPDNATRIEITDQNVFTTCPTCGREIRVDLMDMLQDPDFDLYGTQVVCADCAPLESDGTGKDNIGKLLDRMNRCKRPQATLRALCTFAAAWSKQNNAANTPYDLTESAERIENGFV